MHNDSFNPEQFAKWLTDAFTNSKFKSLADLAEKAGTTRSTVSRLAGAKKQGLTGKASRPNIETVDGLARALNRPIEEARIAAGHSPSATLDEDDKRVMALFLKHRQLKPEQKAAFRPIVKMIERELDFMLRTQQHETTKGGNNHYH